MSNYKFGIVVSKKTIRGYRNIGICNCGQHVFKNDNRGRFHCDNCGNEYFVNSVGQKNRRFTIPYLEAERKDNRGFKVSRTNLSVIYDGDSVILVKRNITRTMEYDIVDKVLKVWREDVVEYDFSTDKNKYRERTDSNRLFFTNLSPKEFLEFVSNEVTRDMYTDIVYGLSRRGIFNKKEDILKGLEEFMNNYPHLQILANAGIPKVSRFYATNSYYYAHRYNDIIDKNKTKPHEILKVPKFMITYIREDLSIDNNVLSNLQGHFKTIDNNKFREIMSIVKDEGTMKDLSNCIEIIMQIHVDYGYTNIKNLVLYLFRTVRLTQGITSPRDASTYLRDYIRMSRHMNLEYEKYPKSLKKVHDVVQLNYKTVTSGREQQELFKYAIDKSSYKNLEFIDNKQDFAIVLPKESEDLIKEGNELSHCVASYVKDVINDKCKILFLRNKEDIDTPLATIEVRGFNIRQARGYANRSITEKQREFIKTWAEKNNLIENYY